MRLIDADKVKEYMEEQQLECIKRGYYMTAVRWQVLIEFIDEQPTVKVLFGTREYFDKKCPYTNKQCESWACLDCDIEKVQHEYLESEAEE